MIPIREARNRGWCALKSLPGKVCVVDDDEAVRDSMCAWLKSYGIEVEAYPSAHEFLACSTNNCDCVLLDLNMPDMDGLQLLGAIRARGCLPPVIMLTACGDAQLSARVLQAGAYALMNKPVQHEILLRLIASAVARAAAVGGASHPPFPK